jgi:AcrR family transcriptional regulator
VFSRIGVDKARMDDIARETQLSKATLYLYFKSKQDLVVATLERMFSGAFDGLEEQPDVESDAAERIQQFTDDAIRGYRGMIRILPMVLEFLALTLRSRVFREVMKRYLRRYMKRLVPIVQSGIETGEFRAVDAEEVAIAAAAILEGTVLLWAYDRDLVDVERHIRSGMQLLLDGIRA